MTLNTYEVIDLNDETLTNIAKFKRYKVLAETPIKAVETLFPNNIVIFNVRGLGNVVVKDLAKIENGDLESNYTYDLK